MFRGKIESYNYVAYARIRMLAHIMCDMCGKIRRLIYEKED